MTPTEIHANADMMARHAKALIDADSPLCRHVRLDAVLEMAKVIMHRCEVEGKK